MDNVYSSEAKPNVWQTMVFDKMWPGEGQTLLFDKCGLVMGRPWCLTNVARVRGKLAVQTSCLCLTIVLCIRIGSFCTERASRATTRRVEIGTVTWARCARHAALSDFGRYRNCRAGASSICCVRLLQLQAAGADWLFKKVWSGF